MPLQPGQQIAHYRIVEKIGEGGMGEVYRAEDTELGRSVAIKVLPDAMASDPERLARFRREAQTVASLNHPNIVTVFSVEQAEGIRYLTMELVVGKALQDLLPTTGFSLDRFLALATPLADAVASAHARGVVHRDLKPANVMVTEEGDRIKILDFGLAKLTVSPDAQGQENSPTLMQTQVGQVFGTPNYMSPEQARGHSVDQRSDIFSLGVMFFEMATGQQPFQGPSTVELLSAVLHQPAPALGKTRPDLPPGLGRIIERCLEKLPEDRYQTARHLCDDLQALRESSASTSDQGDEAAEQSTVWLEAPKSAAGVSRRNRPGRRALVFTLAVVALAVAGLSWWGLSPRQPTPAVATGPSDLLAVLPFSVRGGEELAYLGEGMVDLMSSRLDGLGETRTVDPRVVFAQLEHAGLDVTDTDAGAILASRIGASRYVTGDLVQLGERITLTAYLHHASEGVPAEKATVEGRVEEVFALIDGVVADLATHSISNPADRLRRSAALSSESLEATKEYLRGEKLLRAGRYRDAAEAYQTALTFDPGFALAHYRKSLVADWIDAPDVRTSAERALEFSEPLSPRDKELLEALLHRRHGRNRQAEQAYRGILHWYPNEVEALLQLGEVLFHDNPRVGRSMLESIEPFARALELEPTNANARIHLARLYALLGQHEELRLIAEAFAESSAESERLIEVEALRAFVIGDEAGQQRVVEQLEGKPPPFLFYAAHGVTRFARSAAGAQRILTGAASDDPLLLAVKAGLYLEQGRFAEFEAFLDTIPDSDSACWDLYRAFVLTSGVIPLDDERMTALLARVRRLTPDAILAASWLPPHEDMTPEFAVFERDYHVALLAIHMGRIDEARQVMHSMAQGGPLTGLGALKQETLAGLEAEILLRAGDEAGALDALRTIEYEIPHAITVRSVGDGTRSRFLRAELERAAGQLDVAEAFYSGLDQSWSWWDTAYRPQVYWGLARIAESQGRKADARTAYQRLLDLWQNPDSVLVQRRRDALAALDALGP